MLVNTLTGLLPILIGEDEMRKCKGFCCTMSKDEAVFMMYFLALVTLLSWASN